MIKKNDPTINPTSPKMTGWFYLPHFGDDTTEAENDEFGRTHLLNYGKTFPKNKSPLEVIKEFFERLKGLL